MTVVINGRDITPWIAFQGVKWSRNDVDGPNAGRNLQGTMIRDRVATKIRLDITCIPLTDSEHRILMNLISGETVTVNVTDPMRGNVSMVMYSNNHGSQHMITRKNGTEYWDNISFPLIEV